MSLFACNVIRNQGNKKPVLKTSGEHMFLVMQRRLCCPEQGAENCLRTFDATMFGVFEGFGYVADARGGAQHPRGLHPPHPAGAALHLHRGQAFPSKQLVAKPIDHDNLNQLEISG